ncbi:MAG: PstS family phosphate ABC transporter substrate-binding protein [Candidatus Binatia bacterium]
MCRKYLCLLSVLFTLGSFSLQATAETIKVGGTGSALGTMSLLMSEFQKTEPDVSITVVPNLGSTGSIKALAAGAIELALTSRPLRNEEQAQGLIAHEYGKTPFVLITNKTGVTNLATKEVVAIYAGQQTKWPDGSPIRLVLRPPTDSDNLILARFSPETEKAVTIAQARKGMVIAVTDQDAVESVQSSPGALGTSSLALILSERRSLTPLAINGVTPGVETLADKTYPYFKIMFVVTRKNTNSAAMRFVEFMHSADGRRILTENGHWVTEQ